eukprot:jgi/Tetstr1/440979/TSEL_029247.t1
MGAVPAIQKGSQLMGCNQDRGAPLQARRNSREKLHRSCARQVWPRWLAPLLIANEKAVEEVEERGRGAAVEVGVEEAAAVEEVMVAEVVVAVVVSAEEVVAEEVIAVAVKEAIVVPVEEGVAEMIMRAEEAPQLSILSAPSLLDIPSMSEEEAGVVTAVAMRLKEPPQLRSPLSLSPPDMPSLAEEDWEGEKGLAVAEERTMRTVQKASQLSSAPALT